MSSIASYCGIRLWSRLGLRSRLGIGRNINGIPTPHGIKDKPTAIIQPHDMPLFSAFVIVEDPLPSKLEGWREPPA